MKVFLLVLPDILMFNMRVLYYHDDNEYSCAILVYCCLNVTLFFYDYEIENCAWEWRPSLQTVINGKAEHHHGCCGGGGGSECLPVAR